MSYRGKVLYKFGPCALQGGVINNQQYVGWREGGVAFQMREGVYQTTNTTLLSKRIFTNVSIHYC